MTPARTIGASDVATILGLSPYRDASPFALWARLTGQDTYRSEDTAAQARGHMMEPGALLRVGRETGTYVQPNSERMLAQVDAEPWRHATPDGYAFPLPLEPLKGPSAGVEVKALQFLDGWGDHGTNEVRTDYLAQVVWQMACSGVPHVYVGAFGVYFDDWRLFEVRRDKVLEARIVRKVRAWWDRHVVAGVAPDLDDSLATGRALGRVYHLTTGEPVEAEASDLELVRRLATVEESLAGTRSRREQLRNELRARMGPATHLTHDGRTLARFTKPGKAERRLILVKEADAA